jgi:hypothetical protein
MLLVVRTSDLGVTYFGISHNLAGRLSFLSIWWFCLCCGGARQSFQEHTDIFMVVASRRIYFSLMDVTIAWTMSEHWKLGRK